MKPNIPSSAEPAQESGREEQRVDLRLYLHIIRRRFWVLLAVIALALGAAIFLTSRMPRKYRAESTVVVNMQPGKVLGQTVQEFDAESSGWWQGTTFLKTQEEVLNSRQVARLAAEKMKPELRAKLLDKPGTAANTEEDLETATELIAAMREVKPGKDSRKFTISAVHTDPQVAAEAANGLLDAFVNYSLARRQDASTAAEAWLSARLDQLEDELKTAEQKLQDFKSKNGLLTLSLQDQNSGLASRMIAFNKKLDELQVKRIELAAKISQLQRIKGTDPANDPSVLMVGNPILDELKKAYAEQYRKLVELRAEYLEKHPKIQAQEAVLESVRREIHREATLALVVNEAQYRVVLTTEGEVRRSLKKTESEAMNLGQMELEFKRMERVASQKAKYYEMVLARYVESGLAKKLNTNNVQILDRAVAPLEPFSPRIHVNLAIAGALGLVLGLGLIFLLHFMDNTVKTQEDVEQLLGLPYLGLLPRISVGKKSRRPKEASDEGSPEKGGAALPLSPDLVQWQDPKSLVAEHCRSIRTSLLFMSPDKPLKALLISSSVPQEGKTTVAINLAISMAQSGDRVVIVDTDMRRPRVHKSFGIKAERGISAALLGEVGVGEVIHETPIPNLWVIPCGATPPNPAELLHTKRFQDIIEELKGRFDRVVFDAPPVGAVTDPVILSKATDGTILVVKTGVTPRQLLGKTGRVIQDVNANLLGIVLNDIDPERRTYGGYYQQYYYRRRYMTYYGEGRSDS